MKALVDSALYAGYKRLGIRFSSPKTTNWFPDFAWEPTELQAPPAVATIGLRRCERRSLEDSAFPGRAWERGFS